jgi:hypothetical protein
LNSRLFLVVYWVVNTAAKFIVFDWGDKVISGKGLLSRPARLHWLAGQYDNPMPESTILLNFAYRVDLYYRLLYCDTDNFIIIYTPPSTTFLGDCKLVTPRVHMCVKKCCIHLCPCTENNLYTVCKYCMCVIYRLVLPHPDVIHSLLYRVILFKLLSHIYLASLHRGLRNSSFSPPPL